MNCAFEDCVALAEHLTVTASLAEAFTASEAERKPNAEAIQQMALENYIEMRDKVDDADFLLQRHWNCCCKRAIQAALCRTTRW